MYTKTVLSVFLFGTLFTFAQVGIGTTNPDPGSVLDIKSTDKGILIPRVALTATNSQLPITPAAIEGMMVYNTATAGTAQNIVTPGFYFWGGTMWVKVATGGPVTKDWTVTGNGDTSPTDFLGTTNASNLVFKTNDTQRMVINNAISPITGTAGDISIGDATSGTLKANTELVLRQDGDVFGSSTLRLRNRNGENGAVFETLDASAYLVDFLFKTGATASPIVSNIRFETRSGSLKMPSNTTEFQFGKPDNFTGGPTLVIGANGTGSNSSFRLGKVGIGTTAPTAKLEIDATDETIPPLEIVPSATVPTGTANGQIMVMDNSIFIFDVTRNKWLSSETISTSYTLNGGSSNEYLRFENIRSQNSGPKMPFAGTIVAITAQSSGGVANKGFEIRKNGAGASLFNFNLAANTYTNTTTNINFNAGDFLNVFVVNAGIDVNDPSVLLFIKWRK